MKLVSTLILMCLSTLAFASEVGYEVEVIIFEDRSGLYENSEQWPVPDIVQEANTITTLLPNATDTENTGVNNSVGSTVEDLFQLISQENYRLTEYVEKLSKIPDYKVLVHKAWNQPGLDQEHAVPFKIDSRKETQKQQAEMIKQRNVKLTEQMLNSLPKHRDFIEQWLANAN